MAMAGFSDIIGHEQIIGHLKNAIALDKVSHAYIFNGPKLSGKMMLAEAFAMALQCEGEGTRPCLLCRSCKQAVDHNQPDIIYVSHEKPNTIGVDDIRTQINNDIVIKPYSSRYKVYIVDEAENNRGTAGICGHPASYHKCGQFSANDFIALHYTESQSGKRRCDQILPDENVSHSGLPGRCLCRIFPGKCRESHSAGIFRRIWGTESIGAAADEASGRY